FLLASAATLRFENDEVAHAMIRGEPIRFEDHRSLLPRQDLIGTAAEIIFDAPSQEIRMTDAWLLDRDLALETRAPRSVLYLAERRLRCWYGEQARCNMTQYPQ